MATAATSLLGLALPVTGELSGTWGDTVNVSITALLDTAVAGTTTLSSDADVTLTTTTLAANQARQAIILWTAGGTVTRTITVPAQSKSYIVINKTSSSQSIKIVGAGPTTGVTIVAGTAAFVVWNGVDFVTASVTSTTGILPVANGGTGLSSGTSGGVLAYTATGTLASSAALAASALVIGGGAGAAPSTTTTGTGVVTALGVNTGTAGAFVVNGGALGTPSSGTVTNLTGTASININGTVGATTPGTGAFTTLSATGQITSQSGNDTSAFKAASATTGYSVAEFVNTAGRTFIGVEGAANTIMTNSTAGATILESFVNKPVQIGVNGVLVSSFSSTGLAVTGTLSATGTLSGGTSGTAYSFSGSAPATSLTLDASGNLGLGVTPSAWDSLIKVLELNNGVSFGAQTDGEPVLYIGVNNYYGAGADRYKVSSKAATRYRSNAGEHAWFNAPSGTAGNAISFTQAMTLDASGRLVIGDTTATQKLTVVSTSGTYGTAYQPIMQIGNTSSGGTVGNPTGLGAIVWSTDGTATPTASIEAVRENPGAGAASALYFRTGSSGGGTTRAVIDSSGKLGIGTSTPTAGISLDKYGTAWNPSANTYPYPAGNVFLAMGAPAATDSWFGFTGGYGNSSGSANILLQANINNTSQQAGNFIGSLVTGATSANLQFGTMTAAATNAGNSVKNTQMTLDASGNLGLGVTPSAWGASFNVLEIGARGNSVSSFNSGGIYIGANNYFDGTNFIYKVTAEASQYYSSGGLHIWQSAASGTAGGTISFSERMRLDSSGNLLVGQTSQGTIGSNSSFGAYSAGYIGVASTGDSVFSRRSTNGDVVTFRRDTSSVGAIAVTTTGVTLTGTNGITFTAAQTASADANTLDDYEEGTWTPVVALSATNPTVTYVTQFGSYTKVGRLVTVTCNLQWSAATGGSGDFRISGLPFNVANLTDQEFGSATFASVNVVTSSDSCIKAVINSSVLQPNTGYGSSGIGSGAITGGSFNKTYNFTLTYFSA